MKQFKTIFKISLVAILFYALGPVVVLAHTIEDLNLSVEGDIVLGPGKIELWMEAGDKQTKELLITNRTGETRLFTITIEDFEGSKNSEIAIQFMGGERGPYSLKDYLKPEMEEFTLEHGQRMKLPVEVVIPEDAEAGGLYGAVLVSSSVPGIQEELREEQAGGQLSIITQIASLFFIRVKGDTAEEGVLKEFSTRECFHEKGPVWFQILYENNGNVHLSPYGVIQIKNILGKVVGEIELDPWFVMPDSLREREIKWDKKFLFGRYTANLSLNLGHQDIIKARTISFWVLPWKIILMGLIIVLTLIWIVVRFQIKKRRSPKLIE